MYVCTLTLTPHHTPPHPTGGFGTNIMEVQYVCLHPHPHPPPHPPQPHWRVWYKYYGGTVCMFAPSPSPSHHTPHPTGGFGTNIMEVQYVCLHPHPHPHPPTPLEGLVQILWRYSMYVCTLTLTPPPPPPPHWRVWYKYYGGTVCMFAPSPSPPPPPPPPHWRVWYKYYGGTVCMFAPSPSPPHHRPPTPLEGLVQILWRYSMYVCTLTPHPPPPHWRVWYKYY